ncbi:MAG: hypothetical protein E8D47_05020 [Nitrospira sp.]|nr:MAG: hypothetical protein E8D47_05020 [Nitrospira sp.]
MADVQDTRINNPPYISSNVWHQFFEKMQRVNRPSQLSVELLGEYGITTGQSELLSALRFLKLIDGESKPTEKFSSIQLKGEAFKEQLRDILRSAYRDLFEKHPLEHASYDDLQNYFSIKYSQASSKKMAKSFGVLCQFADLQSPAFSSMRSIENATRAPRSAPLEKPVRQGTGKRGDDPSGNLHKPQSQTDQDELVREFIKTNPMPTGVQWNAETLKAYFEGYRATLRMLRGEEDDEIS